MLEAALDYAMIGWLVFPCKPSDKTPLVKWSEEATTDPAKITAWWKKWPKAMIGLAAGRSGLVVLDIDANPAKGKVGLASFTALGVTIPDDQLRVRTPTGGIHLYFEMPSDFPISNSQNVVGKDIDIRANGGYVIAAPSMNVGGGVYVRKGVRIPPVPDWLRDILERERPSKAAKSPADQKATIEEVRRVLRALPNDGVSPWCDTYEKWQRVCAAIKGAVGEDGLELWLEWNDGVEQGEGYEPEKKWREAGADYIGWVALRKMAEAYASVQDYEGVKAAEASRTFDDGVEHEAADVAAPLDVFQLRVARWIAATEGEDYRWNASTGRWMMFTGDVWEEQNIDCGAMLATRWTLAHANVKEAHKFGFASGVSSHLRNMNEMVVTSGSFDQELSLVGVPAGVLNLRTGAVRAARAKDMISKQLAAAPGGDCPHWERFLSEACSGDAAMMKFLQRWAGYCLTGDVREQKFVYLWGPGGNGKSLFMETIQAMMGGYALQARAETFVKRPQKGHPEEIARMAGMRLIVVPEISGGDKWDVDLLKEVTGNATMTARYMFKSSFTFPVTFKVMSCGNHQPVFPGGVNKAVERRLIYGKFENQPKVVDTTLAEKFRAEMGGIVAWALEGLKVVREIGLGIPDSMADAAAEYFANVDPVLRWRDENLEKNSAARTPVSDLYKDWDMWRKSNNVYEFESLSEFSKMLRAKGLFEIIKPQNISTIKGWRLKVF